MGKFAPLTMVLAGSHHLSAEMQKAGNAGLRSQMLIDGAYWQFSIFLRAAEMPCSEKT